MLYLIHLILTKLGDKKIVLFAAVDTLIVIVLLALHIFRSDPIVLPPSHEKALRDSIALSYKKIDLLQTDINRLRAANDSLTNLKTNIQIQYETRIKYIYKAPLDTISAFIHNYLKGANQDSTR